MNSKNTAEFWISSEFFVNKIWNNNFCTILHTLSWNKNSKYSKISCVHSTVKNEKNSNHISNRQLSLFKQETAMASNSNFFAHTFLTKAFSSLMVFPMVLTIIFSLVKKVWSDGITFMWNTLWAQIVGTLKPLLVKSLY